MFTECGKLGVKLMVTELDVSVLPKASDATGADINRRERGSDRLNPYVEGLPVHVQHALAEQYADIFRLFLKHADKLDRITFWGVHNGQSWRNGYPILGRTDYPLLFGRNLKPKPAFDAVL